MGMADPMKVADIVLEKGEGNTIISVDSTLIPEGGQRLLYDSSLSETLKCQWIDVDRLCPSM